MLLTFGDLKYLGVDGLSNCESFELSIRLALEPMQSAYGQVSEVSELNEYAVTLDASNYSTYQLALDWAF